MDFYGINVKQDVTAEGTPDLGTSSNPFGEMHGEATSAQWGDLAEKYNCRDICEEGTVMCVSEDEEFQVEPCNIDLDPSYVGVRSTKPGFIMNNQEENGEVVGLVGLVSVKILGPVNKKDFIVPTVKGCARAGKPEEIAHKIGVVTETNLDEEVKLVKCIIR